MISEYINKMTKLGREARLEQKIIVKGIIKNMKPEIRKYYRLLTDEFTTLDELTRIGGRIERDDMHDENIKEHKIIKKESYLEND